MSLFTSVEMLPEDPILSLPIHFAADTHEKKVNLGVGSYRDGQGKPVVLSCVRQAEKLLFEKNLNKEYLPIEGNAGYNAAISKLLFGPSPEKYAKKEMCTVQTVGGTGALRVGAELLARNRKMDIYISDPSWPNHRPILTYAGMSIHTYPYYHKATHDLDFAGMCEAIHQMHSPGVILLHACCHNPTGIDPTREQWHELSELIKKKKMLPFFDVAYQGFGLDVEEDVYPVRHFLEQGHELLVASSCSKNFGLYGERVGSLTIVMQDSQTTQRVLSQVKQIIRSSYSMPPLQGGRIVETILHSEQLTNQWKQELGVMRLRVKKMRQDLAAGLKKAEVARDVKFFEAQQGIFSFTGLNVEQVRRLRQEYGIYMTANGRISIAGLNESNIQYVIEAFAEVMKD